MPRRDYYDDEDDRPRPRSRRRYEDDEDDDYDDRPRRRRRAPAKSNPAPAIVGALAAVFAVLALGGVGAWLAFRPARQAAPPPGFVNAPPPPPMAMNPMGPMGPGGVMPPGGVGMAPGGPAVAPAAAGTEVVISNLRLQGFGARQSLVFDYRFPRGQPFPGGAQYVAVVTEPGQQPDPVVFHFLDQQGTMSIDTIGAFGRAAYPSGTTVYMGKRALGGLGTPTPISNTLTLP